MGVVIHHGDCRDALLDLPDESVHCVVTSPPYFGLRCYGHPDQIGLEPTPEAYVAELVAVFREVRRVLRKDGTLWLNLGDSYAGSWGNQGRKETRGEQRPINGAMIQPVHDGRYADKGSGTGTIRSPGLKPKDLIGIPWRVAFALQADGWWLRQDIIWAKPNPMPESVTDRCTKAHEYVFLLTKSRRYFYDAEAVAEAAAGLPNGGTMHAATKSFQTQLGGKESSGLGQAATENRNRRSVWTIATQPYAEAHFATFPPELPELCIKAGCPKGGTVLDPFAGAGTTGLVADRLGRNAILIELNPDYGGMAHQRIVNDAPLFAAVATV